MEQRAAWSRVGWLALLGGAGLAFAVQITAPVGVPLFDGVVVQELYRYLHPASGQSGTPSSYTATLPVNGSASPEFAAATTEQPPQAQVIALGDAFKVPAGATAVQVSLSPVDPPSVAPNGSIAGNVYRVSVTDQAGTPLAINTCEGCLSMSMRAPDGTGDATIQRFADGAWTEVQTNHGGATGLYSTNLTALGDYAIVAGATSGGGVDIVSIGIVVLALVVLVVAVAALVLPRFRPRPSGAVPTSGRSRVPSKRKGPRPPTGRKGP